MDVPAAFADARPHLVARPVGRTPLGIRALRLALDEASPALDTTVPVAGDVLVGLVLDGDVPVIDDLLRQWGVTLDQALTASFEVHGAEDPRVERIEGALLVTDRSYAAFLLRTPSAAVSLLGVSAPVAVVPTDRHLVLAASGDPAALAAALAVAERLLSDAERPVSASALVVGPSGWEPFALPETTEPFASDLARRFASIAYGLQRPLLQAFYDRSGQDCVVADAELERGRADGTRLTATLLEGVATALPWVDEVSLVRQTGEIGRMPMGRLAEIPDLLVALPDLDPPRWYPLRFPDELVPPA